MTPYELLISIILFFVVLKWLAFILMLPPVRVYMKWKLKYAHENHNLVNQEVEDQVKYSGFKNEISRYFNGYLRYHIFLSGSIPSHLVRNFIYKNFYFVNMGEYATFYHGAELRSPYKLKIGTGTIIGDNAILDARNGIEIGNDVNFSSNVSIWSEQHNYNDPYFRCTPEKSGSVKIGDRAWIGPNVVILHDVTIGEGAVIAANAVVTKDVEPFSLVAGVPAKKMGERNKNLVYELKNSHLFFL